MHKPKACTHKTNNIYIQYSKKYKDFEPIGPVVYNTLATSYKNTEYFNYMLNNLINLPYTYTTKNSFEITQELNIIQIIKRNKMISLHVKYLYINLPVQ